MKKEEFEKLSKEDKFNVVKTYLDLLFHAITSRMSILPFASGLAAALLVIATFNNSLLEIDCTIKVLLSILLLIIPFSLFLYDRDLKRAEKINKEYLGNMLDISFNPESKFLDKLTTSFPTIFITILSIVIIILIYKILY